MIGSSEVFKYNTLFYPGNFFIFWNILVPASVFINVHHCGLRAHELGLFLALSLNPIVLKYVLHSPIIAWGIGIFLIVWIHRVVKKWVCYNIYTKSFGKSLMMMAVFVTVPSIALRILWSPLGDAVEGLMRGFLGNDAPCEVVYQARDLVLLSASVMMLLHSFYFYNSYNDCINMRSCKEISARAKTQAEKCNKKRSK